MSVFITILMLVVPVICIVEGVYLVLLSRRVKRQSVALRRVTRRVGSADVTALVASLSGVAPEEVPQKEISKLLEDDDF